jgi:hypothetical protein
VNIYRICSLIFTLFFINLTQASSSKSAQAFAVKIDTQGFSKALEYYHKEFGRYPSTEEGLAERLNEQFAKAFGKKVGFNECVWG